MLKKMLLIALVCVGWYASAGTAQAQVIWGGEAERYFRPGSFVPNDGIPYQIQYGYDTNSSFLQFGATSGSQLRYLDYWDRVERAYKFGYAPPQSPYEYSPPSSTYYPRVGFGLGIFRR